MTRETPDLDSYDTNFYFELPVALENERVKIVPFRVESIRQRNSRYEHALIQRPQPSVHGSTFFAASALYPQIWDYIFAGPFPTEEAMDKGYYEGIMRSNLANTLFAIFDKTKPSSDGTTEGAFAGTVSYINSSAQNLALEIGFVLILPPFQRSHVTSNVVGLLLHYALDLPAAGGLGIRRVVWQANARNAASVGAALRMGFVKEGVLRWQHVLPEWKNEAQVGNGKERRQGDSRRNCSGRDTAVLSLCWDDWEGGAREVVDKVMARGLNGSD